MLMQRKHNLLADEMGLGKTIQGIELINRLKLRTTIIICKASIKRNWERKLKEWLVSPRVIQIIDTKTDNISDLSEIIIVNYDLITHSFIFHQLIQRNWDLLICDEAHYLKNLKAKRTVAVLAKNGIARVCSRSLMMTGTPVLNRPIELYPMLKVLAPTVIAPYSDYFRFAKRYCDAWQDGFGLNVNGASHTDELNKKLRQHYMIRRLTHEVEVQLPQRRYEIVYIDQVESAKPMLRTLENAQRRDFKHQDLGVQAGELAKLRRETAEEKVQTCMEQIKAYVSSCDKIVIFAYHHSVIEKLEKELHGFGYVSITGSTSQLIRQKSIDEFQKNDRVKVFIGQIQAAGEGIDGLQNVCSNILFIESSWVPGEVEQAIKRVHRLGQTKPVLVRFLVWADSIEEHMLRVALDKVKTIREILK